MSTLPWDAWNGAIERRRKAMILTDRELMQQALDVLKECLEHPDAQDVIDALVWRLAQP
jgi:hypothetical protein